MASVAPGVTHSTVLAGHALSFQGLRSSRMPDRLMRLAVHCPCRTLHACKQTCWLFSNLCLCTYSAGLHTMRTGTCGGCYHEPPRTSLCPAPHPTHTFYLKVVLSSTTGTRGPECRCVCELMLSIPLQLLLAIDVLFGVCMLLAACSATYLTTSAGLTTSRMLPATTCLTS